MNSHLESSSLVVIAPEFSLCEAAPWSTWTQLGSMHSIIELILMSKTHM